MMEQGERGGEAAGQGSSLACGSGFYQDQRGRTLCKMCGAGSYNSIQVGTVTTHDELSLFSLRCHDPEPNIQFSTNI